MEDEIINISNPIPVKNKGWHLIFDKFIKSIKNYIENIVGRIYQGIPKEIVDDSVLSKALDSNKYYVFENRTNDLTITLADPSDLNIANEYHFVIIIPSTADVPTITFPSELYWQNGEPSGLEVEKAYEFSILDDIVIYAEIDYETVQ